MPKEAVSNRIELRRKDNAGWQLVFYDRTVPLPHTKGVLYLSELLARPRREIPATALAGNDPGETDILRIESDRLKVTKSIKAVLRRINELDPEVAYYLRAAVRTGRRCSYEPPPGNL
jgi:hypothetical protein